MGPRGNVEVTAFGMPWWALALIVIAAFAGSMAGRHIGRARAHRKAVERLAQKADADHEGAKTRHEGGA